MQLAVMLCGYPDRLDKFVEEMEKRWYTAKDYTKAKNGLPMSARAKFREIRFYDVIFFEEIEKEIIRDLNKVVSASYHADEERKGILNMFKSVGSHSFKLNLFRKVMGFGFKIMGYNAKVPWEKYKALGSEGGPTTPGDWQMHGLILGKMADRKEVVKNAKGEEVEIEWV